MTIEVRVPQLPESVADATLVAWHKRPGDAVARDENLVDLETDKVVLEVPAPAAGVLKEITLTDGTTVTSGQLLALIEEHATAGSAAVAAAPAASAPKLSPAAKRVAEENKLDPQTLAGSGRDGRVSKSDLVNYLQAKDVPAKA
ncbi:MAG: biotin/lipoyl-containing protein, partial [Steroidobacteraceae bacterium]